jgi:hypothetical protein
MGPGACGEGMVGGVGDHAEARLHCKKRLHSGVVEVHKFLFLSLYADGACIPVMVA